MSDPFQVTRDFEAALCKYTGAPFAVVVNSCTMAILLAAAWMRQHLYAEYGNIASLPKLTYIGVPYALMTAGYRIEFRDEDWQGEHQIHPLPLWDAARRFTTDMFSRANVYRRIESELGQPRSESIGVTTARKSGPRMQCVSFHHTKILGHSQGGAILHNCQEADGWLHRARFDGRTEGVPIASGVRHDGPAFHCYISPDVSAALLWKLSALPRVNADLPRSDYPDLSKFPAFA
jgi:dTDP-4-amino-4,6-dideoxygalactose transaminase